MSKVVVVIGPGSIGQAIARRIGATTARDITAIVKGMVTRWSGAANEMPVALAAEIGRLG